MKYRISSEAKNDIEEIWLYTYEIWSVDQADRYYNLIFDEIEFIAENPTSGKDYGYVPEGYYRAKVKSHFIFYRIGKKDSLVEIIRVLHQRMDVENRLND